MIAVILCLACGERKENSVTTTTATSSNRPARAPTPDQGPLNIHWDDLSHNPRGVGRFRQKDRTYWGYDFKVSGTASVGAVVASGTNVVVQFSRGFPLGTRFEVGDLRGEIHQPMVLTIDVATQVGSTLIKDLDRVDVGLTVKLESPGRPAGELKVLPLDFAGILSTALQKVADGPLKFGTEARDAKTKDSLLLVDLDGKYCAWCSPPTVIGRAGKLSEVDYIALSRQLPAKDTTQCQYNTLTDSSGNYKGQTNIWRRLSLRESLVTVYARRTGAKVTSRVFAPKARCPQSFMSSEVGAGTSWDSPSPSEEIGSWLKTLIKP